MSARLRPGSTPALLAVVVLALTGCGGSGDSSSPSSAADQTTGAAGGRPQGPPGAAQLSASQRARLRSFTDCLKQRGVEIPSGGPQGGGPPQQDSKTQRAFQACLGRLPQGVGPPGGVAR
jgi:hypothetical protein